jgi:membrane protein required for colicin V production
VNWLDLSLVAVVVLSIAGGFWKGFARTAVGFAAAVVAVVSAFWLYRPMGFFLREYISPRPLANAAGFLIVFGAVMILGAAAEWLLARFFRTAQLSWLDRLLGGAFGLVRGSFVAVIAVLVIMALPARNLPRTVVESSLVPCLAEAAHVLVAAAPDEVRDGFRRARRDLEASPVPEPVKKGLAKLDPDP